MSLLAGLDHEQVARVGELILTAWRAGNGSSMASSPDNALYLREWAADIRAHNGRSVDADRLDSIAGEIERLRSLLTAYVADEDRWNAGKGEPYGSILTETGMLARAALKRN